MANFMLYSIAYAAVYHIVSLLKVTFLASLELFLLAIQIFHYGLTASSLFQKSPLSFTDLPREVRDMIYEEMFRDRTLVAEASAICRCFPLERRMTLPELPTILLASKAIRIEAARYVQLGVVHSFELDEIPQFYKDHARAAVFHTWNDFDEISLRQLMEITIVTGSRGPCYTHPSETDKSHICLGNQLLTTYYRHGSRGDVVKKTAVRDFEVNIGREFPKFRLLVTSPSPAIKIILVAEYYRQTKLDVSPTSTVDFVVHH
jgi:hypothetical protein